MGQARDRERTLRRRAEYLRRRLAEVETALAEGGESPEGRSRDPIVEELVLQTRQQAEDLDAILAAVTDPLLVYDADGNIVHANASAQIAFGEPLQGISGASQLARAKVRRPDGTDFNPDSLPPYCCLAHDTLISEHVVIEDSAGETCHVLLSASPLMDAEGLYGAVSIWHDMTEYQLVLEQQQQLLRDLQEGEEERERLLAEVRRERALLEAIVSQMPGSTVILLPPDGDLLYLRDKILGLTLKPGRDEKLGLSTNPYQLETLDGKPLEPEAWSVMRALRNREETMDRLIRVRHGELSRIVSVNSQPVLDDEGNVLAAVSTYFDVTERVQAEEELRQHRDHLAELVRQRTADLEENNAELRRQGEHLRRLAVELAQTEERARADLAVVLHDTVAQTLAFVTMKAQVAAAATSDETTRVHLAELINLVRQGIREVRSVITELNPIQPNTTLVQGLQMLGQQMAARYEYQVEVLPADELPTIDREAATALYRSVRELLTNAAKHSQAKKITIGCAAEPGVLSVCVEDDGIGFDPAQVALRDTSGFGLFSIAEHLSHFGGGMEVESQPGQGAKFTLRLPLATDRADPDQGVSTER